MKFLSICSGIEAASVAFGPLGWKAVGFSEIEPFPCAVLAHHYPDVPNFGDMTKFREWPEEVFANADAIVGGPPCQAFSVAGLRNGLNDDRGNLTLTYAELINHADAIRIRHGKPPVVVLYENVPGLLSDKTGAFGCFLGALAGEDGEIVPPGAKWTNAGCVSGPQRALAWAVTDAQFFGVAQRRRRVFVVASAREGFDPASLLFEPESVRRDTPPSREKGEGSAGTLASRTDGGGFPGTDEACSGYVQPVGCWWDGGQVSQTLDAVLSKGQTMPEKNRFPAVLQPVGVFYAGQGAKAGSIAYSNEVSPTLKAGDSGTNRAPTIHTHIVHGTQDPCVSEHTAFALGRNNGGENAIATFQQSSMKGKGTIGYDESGIAKPVKTQMDGQMIHAAMSVRRLLPEECEKLQGFPRGYTMIPWRKKPASECPDGPRYKALGNSWAVPNVRWIGERIQMELTK